MLQSVAAQFIGERQLARDRVEIRHRQDAFIRGNPVAGKRAVFKHGHVADLDAGHAVGRIDIQRTGCRSGRSGLPGLRAVFKAGFVDRQRFGTGFGVTRRHHDAVVHAVDGDEHGTRGNVAVRILVGVRELFRQRFVLGKFLHRRIVVVERVAVGAVGIQRDFAVLSALVRTPGEGRIGVRTGHRTVKRVAGDGLSSPFRHVVLEALDGRLVVHDGHGDGAARRGAVHVRHRHGKVMGNLRVRGVGIVLRSVVVQRVGERQLARGRVEARHRQDAFIRGNPVAGKRAVFKHGHVADLDAGHAVGRIDIQRTGCRSGRSGLPGLRAVFKAGFVDRQRFGTGFGVTRRHHDAVVHAVDGDEHGTRGNVAVRILVGVRELFRQRFVLGKFLHRLIVVIERVAVGAVFVQRDCTVLALLRRVRPRKVRAVRTGCRACKGVAIDGSAASFRHIVPEALDGGHVVSDLDTDHSRAAVAVPVRHHDFHFVGDGIVFAATLLAVFLGGLVQRIGIGQIRAVKAGHVQVPLIRLDGIARQGAILPDDDAADGDGRHAVRGGDAHAAVGRRGAPAAAALQGGFVHLEHIVRHGRRKIFSLDGDVRIIRIRAGSGRRHGHTVVVLIIRARLHRICGQLHAAVEADIQTPQMIDAVQQIAAAVLVIAAAARGTAGGRASGGHQVFAKGREEILPANLHTFHLEGRHLFLGIGGVEILQLDGRAILKSQDKIVAIAGQRRRIRGKVEDEASVRSAGDGLCGTSGRLGKTDIGHEEPPEKKWYLSKNR